MTRVVVLKPQIGQQANSPGRLWVGLEKIHETGEVIRAGTLRVVKQSSGQSGGI
jgi:hypothetical protein